MLCALCKREILDGGISEHHLIPRSRGGEHGFKVPLHIVCHKQIHALFGDRELELFYNTVAKLQEQRDVERFVKWVCKKDPGFDIKVRIRRKNR